MAWISGHDEEGREREPVRVARMGKSEELFAACEVGQEERAKRLLREGADPNAWEDGISALSVCCKNGEKSLVKELLERGADPRAPESAMCGMLAARGEFPGQNECLRMVLEAGWDPMRIWKGRTAGHLAIRAGNAEGLRLLLAHGLSPNAKDERGRSLLRDGAGSSEACVRALLEAGADMGEKDESGEEPGHAAAGWMFGDEALKAFLDFGWDPESRTDSGENAKELAIRGWNDAGLRLLQEREARMEADRLANAAPEPGDRDGNRRIRGL